MATKDVVVHGSTFDIMDPANNVREIIDYNLAGESLDAQTLLRVKVPSGGGKIWTIPDVSSPDGEIDARELDVILLHTQLNRTYWADPDAKGTPPDCSSRDNITGSVSVDAGLGFGGACDACPMSKFGSAENKRGQACKLKRTMYFVRENDILPMVVNAPAGSLKNAREYLIGLTQMRKKTHHVITRLTLEKDTNPAGDEFSRIVFQRMGDLAGDQLVAADAYAEAFKPMLAKIDATAEPFQDDEFDKAA